MRKRNARSRVRLTGEERRKVLLDVAEKLFARSGFRGTTTAAIAKEAGVTEPVLYQHFKSKLDLFHVLLREISGDTMRELERMVAGIDDPTQRLMTITQSFPMVGRKFESHYRVMLAGLSELPDRTTRQILRDHYESYARFIAGHLEAIEAFRAGGLDSKSVAFMLLHLAAGFAVMDPVEIPSARGEAYVREVVRFLSRAVAGARD
ncbi:MAG: TetR/AcrR family transcriptional regulator [Planctomycetota bacterium]|jgi:AcrR family transcriptional regulator